jgi:hypothetical protein
LLRLVCLCIPAVGFLLLSAASAAANETPSAQGPLPSAEIATFPVVLFVGDAAHFSYLTQVASNAGAGPLPVAFINGGPDLADISADELRGVGGVVLYGPLPDGASPSSAAILEAFVRNGGSLFVEAGDTPSLTTGLVSSVSALLPVTGGTYAGAVGGQWRFGSAQSPLMRNLDPDKWSPPVFAGRQPWGIQQPIGTNTGSTVLLRASGQPVIVSKRYGAGRVLWSGLNLPYHIVNFSNRTEARFLLGLLADSPPAAARAGVVQSWAVGPYRLLGRLQGVVTGLVVTGVHGTIGLPDSSWSGTIAGQTVACLPVGTSACYLPVPPGAGGSFEVDYRNSGLATPVDDAVVVLAVAVALALPFLLSTRRARRRLASLLSMYSPWRSSVEKEAAEAEMISALQSPAVTVRLSALEAMSMYSISPPWDEVLANLARTDPSELVKDRLAGFVALRQWEPVASEDMRWLRSWAAERQRSSPVPVTSVISGDVW